MLLDIWSAAAADVDEEDDTDTTPLPGASYQHLWLPDMVTWFQKIMEKIFGSICSEWRSGHRTAGSCHRV